MYQKENKVMYGTIVMITVSILTATIFSGVSVINTMLKERGYKQIQIPKEWWT